MKIGRLLLLIIAYWIIAIAIWSCCTVEVKITGPGRIYFADPDDFYREIDTLREEIIIVGFLDRERVGLAHTLFTSCYATSCQYEFENGIDAQSVQVRFNRAFTYENIRVEANTDIIRNGLIGSLVQITNRQGHDSDYYFWIEFTEAFYDKVDMPEGDYSVHLSMETTDGIRIGSRIKAYIAL
ncbi:MAG: hypothetical protein J5I98_12895 [Phaeodactylibacter sp.]|nr:hypothetical protein [Phaeodactylibacter sp.]